MPNWAEHDLFVIGNKANVDRFVRTGYRNKDLHFARLCPLERGEPKDTYQPDSAIVSLHFRTRTQALFTMVTAWDYVPAFYERLPRYWPDLTFACSINGEMGDYGGVLAVIGGEYVNLVRDYDEKYDRRRHGREIRALLKRWDDVMTEGRDWRVLPHDAWERGSVPVDAHFDADFSLYFRSREEMLSFRKRYRTFLSLRRVNGRWQRTR